VGNEACGEIVSGQNDLDKTKLVFMNESNPHTAIILLAAGASRRLGQPKQLLPFGEKTLLEKMAQVALDSGCGQVVVVLGAFFDKTAAAIAHLPVHIAKNEAWENGMGASISCGVRFLEKNVPEVDAALLMLCDQPFVQAAHLKKLVATWQESGKEAVASAYGDTLGVPALFSRRLFGELSALPGEQGAKAVLLAHREELTTIDFPEGRVDLDTRKDWESLAGV
jgi:molybdenum cofactor cytidylyltransferase